MHAFTNEAPRLDHDGPVDWPFEPFPYSALDASISDRFDCIAARHPDRLAVSDRERSLTYSELKLLADRVAAATAAATVGREEPVAILLANEARYPAAMLGVLAAGRAYVALNADDPIQRNRAITGHAQAGAVVSPGALAARAGMFFQHDVPIVDIDALAAVPSRPAARPKSDDLAQILYTSGSTGTPKGVFQDHRGMLYMVLQRTNAMHISHEDRVATVFPPTSDVGVRNVFTALLNGASLHILPPAELGPAGLKRELRARGITILQSLPTVFRNLVDSLEPHERLETIRLIRLGADVADWGDFDRFRRLCSPRARFMMGLGMTECSFSQAQWFVNDNTRATGPRLPVGRPPPEATITIVDDDGLPLADGEIGEIVVASRYLALGYWRDPELTASRFTIDPADPRIRIFRTSDLGRRRADGLLEFVGRKEHHVKLHGHRIDLGEVETALRACSGVGDAVAVVRRNADGVPQSLVAYAEPSPGVKGLLPRHVSAALTQVLPGHMRPSIIMLMPALPRLPTHKVDRKRIAELDAGRPVLGNKRSTDALTDEVAKVFESALGVHGATAEDNLLSLGGNSLQAIEIVLSLERRFGIHVPIKRFEATQTISDLSRWIAARQTVIGGSPGAVAAGLTEVPAVALDADILGEWRAARLDMHAISQRATELKASFRERRSPAFHTSSLAEWAAALDLLFLQGNLALIEHGARHLHAFDPAFSHAEDLCGFFDRLPPAGDQLPFRDHATKDVQIVRREHADAVIFLFCDRASCLGMPLAAIHRWLGRLPASLVYLRDFQRVQFLAGVPSLGEDRDTTVRSLRDLAGSLGARRILCYGNSSGGFAALHYGVDLSADAVVAVSGRTNQLSAFNAHLHFAGSVERIDKAVAGTELDLRQLFFAANKRPRVLATYGEHSWDDRLHAEHLRDVPGVTLHPVEGFAGHNAALELVLRGQFQGLLDWLMAPAAGRTAMTSSSAG
jgi:amino acid adenylation domain-containing protein